MGNKSILRPVRVDLGLMGLEHPRYERITGRPSAERVLKVVAQVSGKGVEDLRTSRRGEANEGRKVAMCLMKRLCDRTLGEVARDFGVKSY